MGIRVEGVGGGVGGGGTVGPGTSGTIPKFTAATTIGDSIITESAGVITITGELKISGLTASKPVFTDASKQLVSTGTLGPDQGGTGIASYTIGDLLYASGATTLSKLADIATGNALISGGIGAAPSWGKIAIASHVSGLGANVATFLGTPSSANLLAALSDKTGTGLAVFDTSPSFTTGLTTPVITITQGTIAADAPQINGTVTWNNSGIVGPAWKLNVTDTSSNAAALLVDFQISTVSKFSLDKTGLLTIAGNFSLSGTSPIVQATNGTNTTLEIKSKGNSPLILTGGTTSPGSVRLHPQNAQAFEVSLISVGIVGSLPFGWASGNIDGNALDTILTRAAAATLQLGAANVNGSAVAQILRVQSAVTGTDQAAANFTIQGSRQTGAGTTGQIIFQTSPKLATGTTQGTYVTALTLTAPAINMNPSVVIGNQALVTTATDGFLYIPTCAGTPTGVPTTFTGRVALIYDTTGKVFWIYDTAWLQPKTPAGAAVVTWQ